MSIKFQSVARKNPVDMSVRYYPTPASPERVTLSRIVKEIEETSTVHEADVKAVIASFTRRIIAHLRDGHSVGLEDLGSFRVSVTGKACATPAEVTADTVRNIRVVYAPSGLLRRSLKVGGADVKLERVRSKYDG